jgi:hypothetical protein
MRRGAVIAAISIALAGCVGEQLAPYGGDLRTARQSCNQQYPRAIGSYLPHAACVNDAIERLVIPKARHPDLVRLQEKTRALLSEKIDRRKISAPTGERKMAQADALVAQAEHNREIRNEVGAQRCIAAINSILGQ